jgi:hypothetical protein
MSQSVTTCLDCSFPARVETFLVSAMSAKTTPLGRQDFLIIDTVAPESSSTRRSRRLLIVPIVLAVKIVTGFSLTGGLITFGPK